MAKKYLKKPVIVEAMQLPKADEDCTEELIEFLHSMAAPWTSEGDGYIEIETLEGVMVAAPLDWIIKGVEGEFYPCKPKIFAKTYDEVTE
jgi:hypothetical protein